MKDIKINSLVAIVAAGLLTGCQPDTNKSTALATMGEVQVTPDDLDRVPGFRIAKNRQELVNAVRYAAFIKVTDIPTASTESSELAHVGMLANQYFAANPVPPVTVTAEEVESFYQDSQDRFAVDEQREVWNLYLRGRDFQSLAQRLTEIRTSKPSHMTFGELARQYSESESRALDGKIGWIKRGQVNEEAEDAIFRLAVGEISEPVPLPGGAGLFYVTDIRPQKTYPLSDVRKSIEKALLKRRAIESAEAALLDGIDPDHITAYDDASALLKDMGANQNEDFTVLTVCSRTLPATQFKETVSERLPSNSDIWTAPDALTTEETVWLEYRRLKSVFVAACIGDGATTTEAQASTTLDLEQVRQRLRTRAESDEAALQQFHLDNRHLYQSTPSTQIVVARSPIEDIDNAASLSNQMSQIEATSVDSFVDAARDLGLKVDDPAWIAMTQNAITPKAFRLVQQTETGMVTDPFQANGSVAIIFVSARREAAPLVYEQVRDRVLNDYVERNQEQLFKDMVNATLESNSFKINDDAVTAYVKASLPAVGP